MEEVWNTFDEIYRTVYNQGRCIEDLKQRVAILESRLAPAPCPRCDGTGILADGQELCDCPAAAGVVGSGDELVELPSAAAEDRMSLRLV